MIAKLKGVVDSVDTDSAIVDVGGVGYLVSASAKTLRNLVVGGPATVLVICNGCRDDKSGAATRLRPRKPRLSHYMLVLEASPPPRARKDHG